MVPRCLAPQLVPSWISSERNFTQCSPSLCDRTDRTEGTMRSLAGRSHPRIPLPSEKSSGLATLLVCSLLTSG